jgi:hypothetical protein
MAKTTITGANQQTDWFDLTAVADSILFTLTGDFADPVTPRYSMNDAQDKGADWVAGAATYSSAAETGVRRLPFGFKYVAFASGGSWSGGKTCIVGFGKGKDPNGQLVAVSLQSAGGAAGIG